MPAQPDDAGLQAPATRQFVEPMPSREFPAEGMPARDAYELIHLNMKLDGQPSLNLASFVTTWMEPEAEALIAEQMHTNHIDHEEYPAAQAVEEACVTMLADLWNAPDLDDAVGVATIGSSEAIMLGLLAHKFRWRAAREAGGHDATRPNVVFGAETHIVWDKFARYFDVEPRKVPMRSDRYVLHPESVLALVDENTIAVGAVLGTTFIGESDPIAELNDRLLEVKRVEGWDVPLHVDAASGGFIAPFARPDERWDFRLEQVASINGSGHKYGLVYPGVGWLVFRGREFLPDDLVFSVNYLGNAQPTFTFNFSRGSAMIQAQYYNFLRLGRSGYEAIVKNMLANAAHLNEALSSSGRFEILNPGLSEPVVTFRLAGDPGFDAFQLSDKLRERGWIIPAYTLPPHAEHVELLRVVVRNDMSRTKIDTLIGHIDDAFETLERSAARTAPERKTHENQRRRC